MKCPKCGTNIPIMNIGIARSLETKGITCTRMTIGTPEYISPKQAEGKEFDQRSDIYSLGTLLYTMIAERVRFEADHFRFSANKKEEIMPKTKVGKWSGILLAVFLVFLIASLLFLHLLEFRRGSAQLLIPAIIAFIAGIGAFVTGLISLLKFKDRSVIVILATIFGFFATLICAMEMVELIVHALK